MPDAISHCPDAAAESYVRLADIVHGFLRARYGACVDHPITDAGLCCEIADALVEAGLVVS